MNLCPKSIEVTESAGFCLGVARAVQRAFDEVDLCDRSGRPIYMFGELIHNRQVITGLEEAGVELAQDVEAIPDGATVILRAHGVTEAVESSLEKKACTIIDGTCAYVKRIHKLVEQTALAGERLIITGRASHPEVEGIVSRYEALSSKRAIVLENLAAADKFEPEIGEIYQMMSQTTFSIREFGNIWQNLQKKIAGLKKFGTICNATEIRQTEAESLAQRVDLMLVVGDFHSSNTEKLRLVCEQFCDEVFQVETTADVQRLKQTAVFADKSVGICAGASTPQSILSEVIQVMKAFSDVQGENTELESVENVEKNENAAQETVTEVEVADASVEGQMPPELMADEHRDEVAEGEEKCDEVVETESESSETSADSGDIDFTEFIDSIPHIKRGETIEGVIVRYDSDCVYVDVRDKSEGKIPMREFASDPDFDLDRHIAERIPVEVYVKNIRSTHDGKEIQLSKQRVDQLKYRRVLEEAFKEKEPVTVRVVNVVKDGVIASYGGCDVYIHRTQLEQQRVEDLEPYRGQTLDILITQFDMDRRRPRIAGSRRQLLNVLRRKQAAAVWDNLEVGDIYEGVVRNTTPFGAFVDIGGVDGLVHISELSWKRIRDPKEVIQVGDTIQVYVKDFDREKKRISLGYKRIEDDPYHNIEDRFPVGSIVKGKVVRMFDFGAFIQIAEGVDALCHISQISTMRLNKPSEVLKEGMEVEARVLDVNNETRRISVSIRDVAPIDQILDPIAAAKRKQEAEFPTSYRDDTGSGADIQITHVSKEESAEAEASSEAESSVEENTEA
ncbi:MAG: 4-hydroxy-3-methylbut-2-enyl diphosphate reductase [Eubacteriales bacterium]|nr:4-hydroxy-3-methylbut-2-enyl diphosphate reductase [Eubacteriales bacterium]